LHDWEGEALVSEESHFPSLHTSLQEPLRHQSQGLAGWAWGDVVSEVKRCVT
jgi:hypothetical protein